MSDHIAYTVADAVERLDSCDLTLQQIDLSDRQHTDTELTELVDGLLAGADIVKLIFLGHNRLTDETGVKLARYLAASSTVQTLALNNNQLGESTHLAVAAALRVNTSLRALYLFDNMASNFDAAFIDALRLNPSRPAYSDWGLNSNSNEFSRLKAAAEHPSSALH